MICFDALVFHQKHAVGGNKFDTFRNRALSLLWCMSMSFAIGFSEVHNNEKVNKKRNGTV